MMLILAALTAILSILTAFLSLRLIRKNREKTAVCLLLHLQGADGSSTFLHLDNSMKRLSSLVTHFLVSALALTATGVSAAVDGAISVMSSDPNVLLVTPQNDGRFHVAVVGTGFATLTVSADADLGDGVRPIFQDFNFEVYDGVSEADHFDLVITDIARSDTPTAELASGSADSENNSTAS